MTRGLLTLAGSRPCPEGWECGSRLRQQPESRQQPPTLPATRSSAADGDGQALTGGAGRPEFELEFGRPFAATVPDAAHLPAVLPCQSADRHASPDASLPVFDR